MKLTPGNGRLADALWFLAWAVASSAACLSTAWHTGATFDEPLHIARGLEGWRTGSHAGLVHLGAMPLPLDLYTLPLYVWERAHGVPFDLSHDVETLVPWFRVGPLVFWWLLLFYGRLIGRQLAGPWGGRLAVAFLACEPLLLAHASLGGTDIAITACLTALVYHFRVGREASWRRRLAWPVFWYGAAVLAKASGLVFGPLCLVVIELERLARQGALRRPEQGGFRAWCRHIWTQLRPAPRPRHHSDRRAGARFSLLRLRLANGAVLHRLGAFAAARTGGRDDGLALRAPVHFQQRRRGAGPPDRAQHARAWCLPAGPAGTPLLLVLLPRGADHEASLPLLLGPLLLAGVRWRSLSNWATVTAAALLLFSLNCHVQIGVRLVMPLVVMLAIGLAAGMVRAACGGRPWLAAPPADRDRTRQPPLDRPGGCRGLAELALLHQPPLGGTNTGYLLLSDSNYDWGQGVPELARWQRAHPNLTLDVWYFGTDPLLEQLPVRDLPLHTFPIKGPDDVLAQVHGHYLAAGTTLVYGSYARGPTEQTQRRVADFLRGCTPVARTTTFLIYDFTQPEQAALVSPPARR